MGALLCRPVLATLFIVAYAFIGAGAAKAQNTEFIELSPRVQTSATFTDNVLLTPEGGQSDIVLIAEPGINASVNGRRLKLAADYSAQFLYFTGQDDTDLRHSAFGLIDLEVVEDRFFVDGRASLEQTFLDRAQSLSGSPANISNNRQLVQNYATGARMVGRLSDIADWSIRYSLGWQLSDADQLDNPDILLNFSDSRNQSLNASLDSGERFGRFGWRAFVSGQRVERNLTDIGFRNDIAAFEVSYNLTRSFEVLGSIGVSANNLQTATLGQDGLRWDAGFRWMPNPRTEAEVRFGQEGTRTIGSAIIGLQLQRRMRLTVTYNDEVAANSLLQNVNLNRFRFDDQFGIVNDSGIPVDLANPSFTLNDVDFRRRAVRANLTWQNRRNAAFVSGEYETRIFDNDSGESVTWGGSAGFDRNLSRRADFTLRGNFRRNLFEGSPRADNVITSQAAYRYQFSRFFTGQLAYNFSLRRSNFDAGNLRENSITVELRGVF